jgi:tRNA(fMet)-specific endonuclease VapC
MSLHILDTEHFTLYRYGHDSVKRRVEAVPGDEVAITIITIEEQLGGWYAQIRQARDAEKLARAYAAFFEAAQAIRHVQVLPFSGPAVDRYLDLRKKLRRVGKLDLAIAAIALEAQAVVVTRNRSDFSQVPGLRIEDWSAP